MPRINATIDLIEFDYKSFTKAMKQQVELQTKEAARAFVRAAVLGSSIPVDTGMAAGSFLNLNRYLKRIGVKDNFSIQSYIDGHRKRSTQKYYHPPGSPSNPIPKDENTPGNFGLVPDPTVIFHWEGDVHLFTFYTKVFHYNLLDQLGSNPWHTFVNGRAAFITEMANLKKRLPKVKDYLVKSTVSLGSGTGVKVEKRIRLNKQQRFR